MRWIRSALAAGCALALGAALVAASARAENPKPPVQPPLPADVLKSMSDFLGKQKNFTLHAEIEFDQLLAGVGKIRLAGALDMAVARPDRLHVDYRDDVMDRLGWLENGRFTLLDPMGMTYSQVTGPKTIDGMVAKLEKEYGLTLPMGELAESDPAAILTRNVASAYYVGIHNVEGVFCHHVVLLRKDLELQIFVEVGDKPVPRKLVLEYLTRPGSPQYTASITDWSFEAQPAELFVPKIPKDAGKVEFLKLQPQAEEGKK
jgi:hypothetical protein